MGGWMPKRAALTHCLLGLGRILSEGLGEELVAGAGPRKEGVGPFPSILWHGFWQPNS